MLEETRRGTLERDGNDPYEIPMFRTKSLVIALDADGLDGAGLAWSR